MNVQLIVLIVMGVVLGIPILALLIAINVVSISLIKELITDLFGD